MTAILPIFTAVEPELPILVADVVALFHKHSGTFTNEQIMAAVQSAGTQTTVNFADAMAVLAAAQPPAPKAAA